MSQSVLMHVIRPPKINKYLSCPMRLKYLFVCYVSTYSKKYIWGIKSIPLMHASFEKKKKKIWSIQRNPKLSFLYVMRPFKNIFKASLLHVSFFVHDKKKIQICLAWLVYLVYAWDIHRRHYTFNMTKTSPSTWCNRYSLSIPRVYV